GGPSPGRRGNRRTTMSAVRLPRTVGPTPYAAAMIDHLGLQATDVEASLAFYLRTFAPLGIEAKVRFPHGDSLVVGLAGPDGHASFWLSPAVGTERRELHVAFSAADRAAVDAVHEAAVRGGV